VAAQIVLITGTNTGIGYETVKIFFQCPDQYHVYLGSRPLEDGNKALQELRGETSGATDIVGLLQIDLSSL
jgi:NAD(P)-dependent dehydrogenase (short-subunit alcohol dehydrogenase family)